MEHVGLADMTPFAKARISGPGATAYLDHLLANRLPSKPGRIGLAHALTASGGVHSEFTIQREAEDSFYLVSAGGYQRLDHDWLRSHLPNDRSVTMEDLTGSMGVLVIAGPDARTLLSRLCDCDLSNEHFPWLTAQACTVAMAPVNLMRVNFVGELGWEIHHPIEYQNHLFDALFEAGEDLELHPFGIRAMDSMRMEKSYRMVGTELSIEYAALESGLNRFVKVKKGNFIGRDGLQRWCERGFSNTLVTLAVSGFNDADPIGNNPLTVNTEVVGRTTSGNYGFRLGQSLALAMVHPSVAATGTEMAIEVLGQTGRASVIDESPYDAENARLRG